MHVVCSKKGDICHLTHSTNRLSYVYMSACRYELVDLDNYKKYKYTKFIEKICMYRNQCIFNLNLVCLPNVLQIRLYVCMNALISTII